MTKDELRALEIKNLIQINKKELQKLVTKDFGDDLSDADYFSILYFAGSAQKYSNFIEQRHIKQVNGIKVSSSLDKGDYYVGDEKTGQYFEFKYTTKENFLQIRDWQDVNYRLMSVNVLTNPISISYYELTKEQMKRELIGAGATHKVKNATQVGEKVEKSLKLTKVRKISWDKLYKVSGFTFIKNN